MSMDHILPCPNCGDTEGVKYIPQVAAAEWCHKCVMFTLEEQDELRFAVEAHEVFGDGVVKYA